MQSVVRPLLQTDTMPPRPEFPLSTLALGKANQQQSQLGGPEGEFIDQ